jgi:hypothetical protein
MPCEVSPIAKPRARSSRTRTRVSSAGPTTAPSVPETRVSTTASGTEAWRLSAIVRPTGEVTERGSAARSVASSAPSAAIAPTVAPMLTTPPATSAATTAGAEESSARPWRSSGSARATVAGPSRIVSSATCSR